MSSIDELIRAHCPAGVEYKPLADLALTVPGLRGKTKADFAGGAARYVSYKNAYNNAAVDQAAPNFVVLRPDEKQNELHLGDVVVTASSENIDDVGMSSVVVTEPSEPLYLNSFCFGLRFSDPEQFLPEFNKYLFRSEAVRAQIRRSAQGVTRINISKPRFMKVRIPVPPIEVQREVARVLDRFTELDGELEAGLRAELRDRRRQYHHLRDALLTFSDVPEMPWQPMSEVGAFTRGKRFTKADVVPEGIASIHYGEIYTGYGVSADQALSRVKPDLAPALRFAKRGDVIIAGVGETVEDVAKAVAWLGDEDVAFHDDCWAFRSGMNPKFVAYYLQTRKFGADKRKHVVRAKVKRISASGLGRIQIPLPARETQDRIVSILDKLDALISELATELQAELKARRTQFECSRDELLTFEGTVA